MPKAMNLIKQSIVLFSEPRKMIQSTSEAIPPKAWQNPKVKARAGN
jgi:hypothetical protein